MITENDLREAIAECQGVRSPTASTCIKLAAFYTIYEHMYGRKEDVPTYSYAEPPVDDVEKVIYSSDTDFGKAVEGRDVNEVLALIDELMTTLQVINPRLYNGVMRRL